MLFGLDIASARLPACDRDKAERTDAPVQASAQTAAGHEADSSHTSCGRHSHEQTASCAGHAADARKVLDRIDRCYRRPNLGCLRLYHQRSTKSARIFLTRAYGSTTYLGPRGTDAFASITAAYGRLVRFVQSRHLACVCVRSRGAGANGGSLNFDQPSVWLEPARFRHAVWSAFSSLIISRLPLSASRTTSQHHPLPQSTSQPASAESSFQSHTPITASDIC